MTKFFYHLTIFSLNIALGWYVLSYVSEYLFVRIMVTSLGMAILYLMAKKILRVISFEENWFFILLQKIAYVINVIFRVLLIQFFIIESNILNLSMLLIIAISFVVVILVISKETKISDFSLTKKLIWTLEIVSDIVFFLPVLDLYSSYEDYFRSLMIAIFVVSKLILAYNAYLEWLRRVSKK